MSFEILLDSFSGGGRGGDCFAPSPGDGRGACKIEHKNKILLMWVFPGGWGTRTDIKGGLPCGQSPNSLRVRMSCKQGKDGLIHSGGDLVVQLRFKVNQINRGH